MRILIICTGNSCRSQMAGGFMQSFDPRQEVFTAGTSPAARISPHAVAVMQEVSIDISGNTPRHVNHFLEQSFDYVITLCDHAQQVCPPFKGDVKTRLHMGFEDPYDATGTPEEIRQVYRRVRDEIGSSFASFYNEILKNATDNQ